MSYTLKKLKQSEVDRGNLKLWFSKKNKSSQGLYVVGIMIMLIFCLMIIKLSHTSSTQHQVSVANQGIVTDSLRRDDIAKTDLDPYLPENKTVIRADGTKKGEKTINIVGENKVNLAKMTTQKFTTPTEVTSPRINQAVVKDQDVEPPGNQPVKEKNRAEKKQLLSSQAEAINEEFLSQRETSDDQLVLSDELPSGVNKSLSEMRLNGVVFHEKEDARYVFINMKKYFNGEEVDLDLTIEEIRQDSVVIRYRNKRVLLSRNQ